MKHGSSSPLWYCDWYAQRNPIYPNLERLSLLWNSFYPHYRYSKSFPSPNCFLSLVLSSSLFLRITMKTPPPIFIFNLLAFFVYLFYSPNSLNMPILLQFFKRATLPRETFWGLYRSYESGSIFLSFIYLPYQHNYFLFLWSHKNKYIFTELSPSIFF